MSRRRYGFSRSDPVQELITSCFALIFTICFLYVLYWAFTQPGAFNYTLVSPTPTPAPTQGVTRVDLGSLGLLLECLALATVGGLGLAGLVWLLRRRSESNSLRLPRPSQPKMQSVNFQAVREKATTVSPDSLMNTTSVAPVQLPNLPNVPEPIPPIQVPIQPALSVSSKSPMTNAERAFFTFLQTAVKGRYLIFPQMPLDRLVKSNGMIAREYYTILENGSIDFVLAHPKYLNPMLAIELDDSSHLQSVNKQRDQIKEALLRESGLELLRFRVGDKWDAQEIQKKIDDAIRQTKT